MIGQDDQKIPNIKRWYLILILALTCQDSKTRKIAAAKYPVFDLSESREGQIIDMISFLEVYSPYLEKLKATHEIDDWRFDLPYECRLNKKYFSQFDYLPPKLIHLAGKLEIGIELSLYWPNKEDTIEEEISADSDTDD